MRDLLESVAERGTVRGAEAVLAAAEAQRRRRVALPAAAAVLTVVVLASAVLAWRRVDGQSRVHVGAAVTGESSGPVNVLVVGVDEAGRADTVMLARLDPAARSLSLLSIPRDVWVESRGSRMSALLTQGATQLIAAVRDITGMPIDHYVQVDFAGFEKLVDAAGGIPILFSAPVRDVEAGLSVPRTGCVVLSGRDALAYVRSRHREVFAGGRWQVDPTGDLGRTMRQRLLVQQALRRLDPTKADALWSSVKVDEKLSVKEAVRLARAARSATVSGFVVPASPAEIEGTAVLRVDEQAVSRVIDGILRGLAEPPDVGVDDRAC